MKLATWNCNQAFRKKQRQLLELDPDIAVVQECENPAKKGDWSKFTDWRWRGDDQNKGLAVFTRNGLTIDVTLDICGAEYFLYIETEEVNVLAVWAMNDKEKPHQRYIGQVYTALQNYSELIDKNTIIAGDFNWNHIWDKSPNSPLCGDFADVRALLNQNELCSAYHEICNEEFGSEEESTFYMHKKEEKSYHIDYVFISSQLANLEKKITVGRYNDWITASDHMPLLVNF